MGAITELDAPRPDEIEALIYSDTHLGGEVARPDALHAFVDAWVPRTRRVIIAGDTGEFNLADRYKAFDATTRHVWHVHQRLRPNAWIDLIGGNHDQWYVELLPSLPPRLRVHEHGPLMVHSLRLAVLHGDEFDRWIARQLYSVLDWTNFGGSRALGRAAYAVMDIGRDAPPDQYQAPAQQFADKLPEAWRLVFGHSHYPTTWRHNGRAIWNCGHWTAPPRDEQRPGQSFIVVRTDGSMVLRHWAA